MPDILWPTSLPDKVQSDSFSLNIGETVVKSDIDIGPQKVRRRFTKQIDNISATMQMTSAQYQTLLDFFRVDLNGGTSQFVFNHPISGASTYMRFMSPPVFRAIGGVMFEVTLNWEIMP